MASMLSRYGIKEVADVTFYDIESGAPVLYLDTLKVSTIEQTAENSEARGGKGNAALISWDYGKEITVTLEDALYSPRSLALIYGDQNAYPDDFNKEIHKTVHADDAKSFDIGNKSAKVKLAGKELTLTGCSFYDEKGAPVISAMDSGKVVYIKGLMPASSAKCIDVSANSFPGVYKIVGDTYARNEETGKDEFFQFIIPKAKVMSESNTITMEAEGDPTVFAMNLKVLRPRDGVMMQLVQYDANDPQE